jgi:hypothetical protein
MEKFILLAFHPFNLFVISFSTFIYLSKRQRSWVTNVKNTMKYANSYTLSHIRNACLTKMWIKEQMHVCVQMTPQARIGNTYNFRCTLFRHRSVQSTFPNCVRSGFNSIFKLLAAQSDHVSGSLWHFVKCKVCSSHGGVCLISKSSGMLWEISWRNL